MYRIQKFVYLCKVIKTENMKAIEVETVIAVDLLKNTIKGLERKLNSTVLKTEVKYHSEALNKSLKTDFDQITNILQSVVDKFYCDSYLVDSFTPMFIECFDYSKEHNKGLLKSIQKVMKFID